MKTVLAKHKEEKAEKEFLNVKEAAAYLGVCYRTMKKFMSGGEIPFRRAGWRTLIERESLRRWAKGENPNEMKS